VPQIDAQEPREPQTNLVPIRTAYFNQDFWKRWDQMTDREKDAYLLGWIAELDLAIRGMSERVQRIDDHLEDDEK